MRQRARSLQAIALLEIVAEPALAIDNQGQVALANTAARGLLDPVLYRRRRAKSRQTAALSPARFSGWKESQTSAIDRRARPWKSRSLAGQANHRWYRAAARAWTGEGVRRSETEVQGIVVLLEDVTQTKNRPTPQRRAGVGRQP